MDHLVDQHLETLFATQLGIDADFLIAHGCDSRRTSATGATVIRQSPALPEQFDLHS
jgi:hypothetical protein